MKILIVEDDASRIEKFKKGLANNNNELTICETADEGIKEITTNKFDVILLDHDLGNRQYVLSSDKNTGYQVALAVKGSPNVDSEFIIHSMNYVGVVNIQFALKDAGCKTIRVIPFCQLVFAK